MESSKVILIGNSASGKTTTCQRLFSSNESNTKSTFPTIAVEVHPYKSDNGNLYRLCDIAGQDQLSGNRDSYYIGANIALIFNGGKPRYSPEEWKNQIKRISPNTVIHYINGSVEEKVNQIKTILV